MNKLQEIRKKNNLTLRELSNALGLTVTALSNYENNYRKPSFEIADRIAHYFDVPVEHIFPRYKRISPYPKDTANCSD